jgi:hypothetical protein
MKKFLLLFSLFTFNFFSALHAQNLVPNPSFEQYTLCPSYQGQVNRLLNWYDPNQGSSDFLATCATNAMVAVPYNFVGTQNARTGNNYAGFGSFPWTYGGLYPMLCEYLQVQLIQPLIANKTYYVSFYVSLADSSEYYTQSIAASFGDTAIHINHPYQLHLPPHITANNPLNDTMSWQKIDGYYHAHGGEQFLTIGYLNDDTTIIDTIKFQNILPGGICDTGAYYYIDDVLVIDSALTGIVENIEQHIETQNFILNEQNNYTFCCNDFEHESVLIEIDNLYGKSVIRRMYSAENINRCIPLDFLESGMYVYTITTENIIRKNGIILNIKN